MRHPQRESAQYCYTERDRAWLEKNGWVAIERALPALLKSSDQPASNPVAESIAPAPEAGDGEVASTQDASEPIKRKPGRQVGWRKNKAVAHEHHDIR